MKYSVNNFLENERIRHHLENELPLETGYVFDGKKLNQTATYPCLHVFIVKSLHQTIKTKEKMKGSMAMEHYLRITFRSLSP